MTRGLKVDWSGWRDELLREHYGKITMKELAKRLGVSVRTLAYHARAIGIEGRTYGEMLEDKDFREAVGRRISQGQAAHRRNFRRYLAEHPEVGKGTRFAKGYRASESAQAKATAAKRKLVYDERVRMKYGLPRRTKLNIGRSSFIDKDRYFRIGEENK